MDATLVEEGILGRGGRKFSSPNRVLVRSFRMSRDRWRDKHHAVQAKLEQERQLSKERGVSRDRWKQDCLAAVARAEAAEEVVRQQQVELESLRSRCEQLQGPEAAQKK